MTYKELDEMAKDWRNVGNLRIATENGNMLLRTDKGITHEQAIDNIASVWNDLPRLFEEVREPRGRLSRGMREIQGVCGRQEASA